MKKITGVSVRTAAEGKCVSYAFREMDEAGNIAALEQAAADHLGEE